MSPEQAVQTQLDAYNAHDLNAFLSVIDENVKVYRPPAPAPTMSGRAALGEFHRTERFTLPALHAELLGRIVLGNKVIDHERVSGIGDKVFEIAAVYEVVDGKICSIWYFPAA